MENVLKNIEKVNIEAFQQDLIKWFKKEQRDLPWRKDKDPYKIWVFRNYAAANSSRYRHSLF